MENAPIFDLKIKKSDIVLLPTESLFPHPDNRPLGTSPDKIEQLKQMMLHDGFDSAHPILVRPFNENQYQIIEGEHRFRAAQSLGYTKLPCVVRPLDDTEALIQLILGNTQSENKPLEIGLNALKVIQKEGKKSYAIPDYAQRLGLSETTIRRYINASEVYDFVRKQLPQGVPILDEVYKLEEIHKCLPSDWVWLHDLVREKDLPKNQIAYMTQALKELKTNIADLYALFDFTQLKQKIAQELLKNNETIFINTKELIELTENSYQQLEQEWDIYEYDVLTDSIMQEKQNLQQWFVESLKALAQLDKQAVLETYKDVLQLKRTGTLEEAERAAAYFRDKKNAKEREEQERLEKQMRQVRKGEIWLLGEHKLYCGSVLDNTFYKILPEQVALAFVASMPYPDSEDDTLAWQMDWLGNKAKITIAKPEVADLQRFLMLTTIPYKGAIACYLNQENKWHIFTLLSRAKQVDTQYRNFLELQLAPNENFTDQKNTAFVQFWLAHYTKPFEVVIDTQAGNGAFLLEAERLGRICYTAENEADKCKSLIEKWEAQTRKRAIKLS